MKKLLTLTAVGTILTMPAMAVKKCVALDASVTTCTATTSVQGKGDWSATCTTDGKTVTIEGVGMCSAYLAGSGENGYSNGSITTLSSTSSVSNKRCWCKMIKPAVSYWVYVSEYTNASTCAYYCADECRIRARSNSEFRSVMFSNLSD